jgi:hypothetical protein
MLPGMSRAAVIPKGRVLRHPGDLQWLERRRLQAADLSTQGKTRAEVAVELGVSVQTASRWYAAGAMAVRLGCAPPARASRPNWDRSSWPGSAGCWTAGRWRPGSEVGRAKMRDTGHGRLLPYVAPSAPSWMTHALVTCGTEPAAPC